MKEVVIKISDAMYKYITMEHPICTKEIGEYLFGLVRCTGTLLPKGHGRLIDADELKEHIYACETNGRPWYTSELHEKLAMIDDVGTVIESDKEGKTK